MPTKSKSPARKRPLPLRVGVVSLGCPKNLVDSEVMLGCLQRDGCEIVAEAERADVIVVNTCAFIEDARRESIETILEMARHKVDGRAKRLVVTGCLVQRHAAELRREIPEIDAVLGPGQVPQAVAAVRGRDVRGPAAKPPTWLYDRSWPRLLATPAHLAYAKIAEGCDYRCSFCVIPQLRGRYRSRTERDVVAEAQALVARGVRELILVAQDTTRYRHDRGARHGLAQLLRRLGKVAGLRWIRVMYAYPTTLSDEVLDAIAEVPIVAKYIDVPLQHGSESVLRRMRRPAGRSHGLGLLERVRRRVPGVALRSSFIVGFPGETAAEFEELLDLVRAAQLDHVGVFTYSHEEGTSAAGLPGQVPARVKQARARRVMALQRRISLRKNLARVGDRVEVLVEAAADVQGVLWRGRAPWQAPDIDGCVWITEGAARPGQFVACEITGATAYDLMARVV